MGHGGISQISFGNPHGGQRHRPCLCAGRNDRQKSGDGYQPETGEKSSEQPQKKLIAFHELADKHRLPTWQSAAVLKLLDKEDDVFLSEQEFLTALEKLRSRSMGV